MYYEHINRTYTSKESDMYLTLLYSITELNTFRIYTTEQEETGGINTSSYPFQKCTQPTFLVTKAYRSKFQFKHRPIFQFNHSQTHCYKDANRTQRTFHFGCVYLSAFEYDTRYRIIYCVFIMIQGRFQLIITM